MNKLQKITSDYYKTENNIFELKKDFTWRNKRLVKIWKLYENGSCFAQPETIKQAQSMIDSHVNN